MEAKSKEYASSMKSDKPSTKRDLHKIKTAYQNNQANNQKTLALMVLLLTMATCTLRNEVFDAWANEKK